MYGRRDPAIKAANPAVKANFHARPGVDRRHARGRGPGGAGRPPGHGRLGAGRGRPGRTSGASAPSRAEVADQDLRQRQPVQQAADQAAVTAFWSQYYRGFNALDVQLAALPPAASGSTSGAPSPPARVTAVASRRPRARPTVDDELLARPDTYSVTGVVSLHRHSRRRHDQRQRQHRRHRDVRDRHRRDPGHGLAQRHGSHRDDRRHDHRDDRHRGGRHHRRRGHRHHAAGTTTGGTAPRRPPGPSELVRP